MTTSLAVMTHIWSLQKGLPSERSGMARIGLLQIRLTEGPG